MWLVFLTIVALLIMGAGAIYIIMRIPRFSIVQKITKNKTAAIIEGTIVIIILLAVLFFTSNLINTALAFIHLVVIWMICDGIGFLINKKRGEKPEKYCAGWIAILITLLYLGCGYYTAHHVVRTPYTITTDKNIGGEKIRIVGFGDSHLGNMVTSENFDRIIKRINAENPDIIVIVGDYIDDDTPLEEMQKCTAMLKNLQSTYGVYYVFGNHDVGYYKKSFKGYAEDELVSALKASNVHVLSDESAKISEHISILGREDEKHTERKEIVQWMKDISPTDYTIVLDHRPDDYDNEAEAGVDLVLSGHTHGGQCLPLSLVRGGPLVVVNDRNYGHEKQQNTDFIVTSGLSDWAIKFKTGCVSEYFVIDVISNQ